MKTLLRFEMEVSVKTMLRWLFPPSTSCSSEPEPRFRIVKQGKFFGIKENDIEGWDWLSEGYEYTSFSEAQTAVMTHKWQEDKDDEVVWEGD